MCYTVPKSWPPGFHPSWVKRYTCCPSSSDTSNPQMKGISMRKLADAVVETGRRREVEEEKEIVRDREDILVACVPKFHADSRDNLLAPCGLTWRVAIPVQSKPLAPPAFYQYKWGHTIPLSSVLFFTSLFTWTMLSITIPSTRSRTCLVLFDT